MLDRYALHQIQNLSTRFQLTDGVPAGVKRNYNVSPTNVMPVVVQRGDKVVIERKLWGFVTQGAKDLNGVFRHKSFNARSEQAFDKVMWRRAIRTQRCIVPMDGYYMWRKVSDGKIAYYVSRQDFEMIGMAGLYSTWLDPDGKEHETFTILTADDNSGLGKAVRRPVMLARDKEMEWINPGNDDMSSIYGCIDIDAGASTVRHEVSQAVLSAKAKGEALIQPLI